MKCVFLTRLVLDVNNFQFTDASDTAFSGMTLRSRAKTKNGRRIGNQASKKTRKSILSCFIDLFTSMPTAVVGKDIYPSHFVSTGLLGSDEPDLENEFDKHHFRKTICTVNNVTGKTKFTAMEDQSEIYIARDWHSEFLYQEKRRFESRDVDIATASGYLGMGSYKFGVKVHSSITTYQFIELQNQ